LPPKAKANAADTNGQAPASPEPPQTARRPRAASAGPKATSNAAREAVISPQAEAAPDASPTGGAASDTASPRPAKKTAKTSTAARRVPGKTAAGSAQEAVDSDGVDSAAVTSSSGSGAPAGAGAGKRSNRTFYLPDELYLRGRNAVAWTSLVPGEAGSYAALTERALRAEVERLEKVYNDGEPFEDAQLKRGPAAGVMERVHALRAKARQAQEGES
jgi:hypothetical protein